MRDSTGSHPNVESEEVAEFLPDLDWLHVNDFVKHVQKMAEQRVGILGTYLKTINNRAGGRPAALPVCEQPSSTTTTNNNNDNNSPDEAAPPTNEH